MKTIMRNFVTLLFVMLLSVSLASAQTRSRRAQKSSLKTAATATPASDAEVDRIFQRFTDAQGDPRVLSLIHSMVMRGIVEVPEYGVHGTLEIYAKEPNKRLTVLNLPGRFGQRLEAYNGRSGWGQTPFSKAFDIKRIADPAEKDEEGAYSVTRKKNYSKISVKGKTLVGGREAVMIEGTFAGTQPVVLYFDTQNGLLVRLDIIRKANDEERGPSAVYFESFGKVNGVVVPTVVREVGKEFSVITRFYEVKFNVQIDDSLFERPKSASPEAKDDSKTDDKK